MRIRRGGLLKSSDASATLRSSFEPVLIDARLMAQLDGTAAQVVDGYSVAYRLQKAVQESLAFSYRVPTNVTVLSLDAIFEQRSAGSGNVCLRLDYNITAEGVAITAGAVTGTKQGYAVSGAAANARGPAANLKNGLVVTAGQLVTFRIYRLSADALDTFAGDIALMGVRVTPS